MDCYPFFKKLSFQLKNFRICDRKRGRAVKQIWLFFLTLILSFIFNFSYGIQAVDARVSWIDDILRHVDDVGRHADDVGRHADNLDFVSTKRNLRKKNVRKNANKAFRRLKTNGYPDSATNSSYLSLNSNGEIELISSAGQAKVYSDQNLLAAQILSDLAASQTTSLILPDETFLKLQDILIYKVNQLEKLGELFVIAPDDTLLRTKIIESANGFERVIELDSKNPNLTMGVENLSDFDNVFRLKKQNLNKSDVRVISLFDESDPDIIDALNRASGEYHIPFSLERNNVDSLFSNQNLKNKFIFVVGHTEGKRFVVRQADNKIAAAFDISELIKVAEERGNILILLGCETVKISEVSGYVESVIAENVAQGIKKAIKAKNYQDMLLSLALEDTFVVRSSVAEGASQITEISIKHEKEAVDAMSSSAGVFSRSATRRLSLNSVTVVHVTTQPSIVKIIFFFYFSLIPLSIFNFRVSWRRFMGVYPLIVPRFKSGKRIRSLFLYLLRAVVFLAILPCYTFVFILNHLERFIPGLLKANLFSPIFVILYILLVPFIGTFKLIKWLYKSFKNE